MNAVRHTTVTNASREDVRTLRENGAINCDYGSRIAWEFSWAFTRPRFHTKIACRASAQAYRHEKVSSRGPNTRRGSGSEHRGTSKRCVGMSPRSRTCSVHLRVVSAALRSSGYELGYSNKA